MRPAIVWPLAATLAVGAGLAISGWAGLPVGALVGVAAGCALRLVEPSSQRADRARAAWQLPVAVDLLAAALRAGAPPERAVHVVGEAIAGPIGRRLVAVARALRVGYRVAEAWALVADVPGAERLVRAAVHSVDSGVALAGALDKLAEDLRHDHRASAEARLHRVAVLSVLPLGLCFLPAFVLTGVVPVIGSVVAGVVR